MRKTIKRLTAGMLSILMLATLAFSVSFSDVETHWAKTYIEDMADSGIFTGYPDGTFRPEATVTVTELLVMLARIYDLEKEIKDEIYAAHKDYLTGVFGTELLWAHPEFAVCLELGVITKAEISGLYQAKSLNAAAVKELLSVFLVRGMLLEPLAEQIKSTSYTLPFADASSIMNARKPYVYVLYDKKIVEGNTRNEFEPSSSVTRAVTATMLSRATAYMQDNNIRPDLGSYGDYEWQSGQVTGVSLDGTILRINLNSLVNGVKSIVAPSTVSVYLDGQPTTYASITTGKYLKVRYDEDGVAQVLRLTSSPATVTGPVTTLTRDTLTMIDSSTALSRRISIAADTEISVPGKIGGPEIMDLTANYASAVCVADADGNAFAIVFSGGTNDLIGATTGVLEENNQTVLLLTSLDGITQRLKIPSTAAVYINGLAGTLSERYLECYTVVKVDSDDSTVSAVEINTATLVKQGSLRDIYTDTAVPTVYIQDLTTATTSNFKTKGSETKAYYNDKEVTFRSLKTKDYVSAFVVNEIITEIYSYDGTKVVSGTIDSITFGNPIILRLEDENGRITEFSLDAEKIPVIKRGSNNITIDKLVAGDTATVTIQFNRITQIDTVLQSASATGTVARITLELAGNSITIGDERGNLSEYQIADNASIVDENGKTMTLTNLKIGYTVDLVIRNSLVTSIAVKETTAATGELSGKVLFVNTSDRSLLMETVTNGQSNNITIKIDFNTMIISGATGSEMQLKEIKVLDSVTVFGVYDGVRFNATIIICR